MKRFLLRKLCPEADPRLLKAPSSSAVVIILGWGGAKQRNLNKLIAYYQSSGVSTVSYVPAMFVPRFVENHFDNEAINLVSKLGAKKVYAHLYSNNGSWTFKNLMERKDIKFDKIVWDSGPSAPYGKLSIFGEAAAIARVGTAIFLRRNQYDHPIVSPLLKISLIPALAIIRVIVAIQRIFKKEWFPDYFERLRVLRDSSPVIPTLFIYSLGDELVPATDVRRFKGFLEDRNVPVSELVFDANVPHTSSFFMHREEYTKLVDEFLGLSEVNKSNPEQES